MKAKINIRDLLVSRLGETPTIPATISIDEVLEFMDAGHEEEIDLHDLLDERRAIALLWDTEMLRSHYPHLTDDQAWEVLKECERHYTAEDGLAWDDVSEVVCGLHPEPTHTWLADFRVSLTDTDGCDESEIAERFDRVAEALAKACPDAKAWPLRCTINKA